MKRTLCLCIASIFFVQPSFAQNTQQWYLPDPDEMIKASNVLCQDQAKSVLVAASLRKEGKSQEGVLALIPSAPKAMTLRVVSAMRENVEDLYSFKDISMYTYYSFRSEVCMRETLGAVRMPRFATVYARVAKCQEQNGTEKSTPLFKCIQSVVREATPL